MVAQCRSDLAPISLKNIPAEIRPLIEALNDYEGAVILSSHDRHLIEATVDRLWLVNNGTVTSFDGDMEEYRSLIIASGKKPQEKDRSDSGADTVNKAEQR